MTAPSISAKSEGSFFKLSVVFAVLFLDFLVFAGIIPLVPLLILEPQNSILPFEYTLQSRCVILGALYSVYPLAQMLFSPLLGALSDRYGRKKMLLTAYLGNVAGYFLFGLGIYTNEVLLLFLGYFIAGATGCNISTTNTIISDLCTNEEKLKRFSLSNMMMGLAFVLGPLFAGKAVEASSDIPRLAFYAFLTCGLVSLINSGIIHKFYKNNEVRTPKPPSVALSIVFKQNKRLSLVLAGSFLLFFGWYSFIKFFQALFLNTPDFKDLEIFNALSYFGVCCVLSQLLFTLFLHKFFNSRKHLLFFSGFLALAILGAAFVKTYLSLMVIVTLFSFAYSILCPCLMYEVSEFGTSQTHGRIMGIYQSVQDLAKILAPLLAGCTMALWNKGPVLIASSFILCSLAAFYLEKVYSKRMRTEQGSNL